MSTIKTYQNQEGVLQELELTTVIVPDITPNKVETIEYNEEAAVTKSDESTATQVKFDFKIPKGKSAYNSAKEIALAKATEAGEQDSFTFPTEEEWIASLKGENGKSAYESAKQIAENKYQEENGNTTDFTFPTEEEWIASLKGKDVDPENYYTKQEIDEQVWVMQVNSKPDQAPANLKNGGLLIVVTDDETQSS